MIKKEITYQDLDGKDVTETFWFHLSQAEMAEMALAKEGKAGGFDVWIRTMVNSQDGEVLVATFKQILLSTIGERSEDNRHFYKTEKIRQDFLSSDAYSVLFMELMTDTDKVTAFINGIVPSNMREQLAKQIQEAPDIATMNNTSFVQGEPATVTSIQPKDDRPDWLKNGRVPTPDELKGATPEQIQEAFRMKAQGSATS